MTAQPICVRRNSTSLLRTAHFVRRQIAISAGFISPLGIARRIEIGCTGRPFFEPSPRGRADSARGAARGNSASTVGSKLARQIPPRLGVMGTAPTFLGNLTLFLRWAGSENRRIFGKSETVRRRVRASWINHLRGRYSSPRSFRLSTQLWPALEHQRAP